MATDTLPEDDQEARNLPETREVGLTEQSSPTKKRNDSGEDSYAQSGTDQTEAFTNGPKNASGASKGGGSVASSAGSMVPGRFGKALKAIGSIQNNKRKWWIGGGIGAGIASLLVAGFFILIPLKLEMFAQNMYRHYMSRTSDSFDMRKDKMIQHYLLSRMLRVGQDSRLGIKNYNSSIFEALYSKMRDSGLEDRLKDSGYTIEYGQENDAFSKKLVITKVTAPNGESINVNNVMNQQHYDTRFQKGLGRKAIVGVVDDVYRDSSWFKRYSVKRRLTKLTGTRWHWLDPVNQKGNKARIAMANRLTVHLAANPKYQAFSGKILSLLFNGKVSETEATDAIRDYSDSVSDESAKGTEINTEATKKLMSESIAKIVSKVGSGPVGWVVFAISAGCVISDIQTEGYQELRKIGEMKANLEYATQFSAIASQASQMKEGKTDMDTFGAAMELMVDKKGRDIGSSNNYTRAGGVPVDYVATTNCNNGRELCKAKQPQYIAQSSSVGQFLQSSENITESLGILKYIPGMPGNVYTKAFCDYVVSIIDKILGFLGGLLDALLRFIIPGYEELGDIIAEKIQTYIAQPLMNHLLPPTVTADTRGPALANATAAGGDAANSMYLRDYCGDQNQATVDPDKVEMGQVKPEDYPTCQLSDKQVTELALYNQEKEAEKFRSLPLTTRIASLKHPRSMASRLVLQAPSTPQLAITKLSRLAVNMFNPKWLLSTIKHGGALAFTQSTSSGASAATWQNTLGVTQFGFTLNCLNNAGLNTDETDSGCKDAYGKPVGVAKFDTAVGCAMYAAFSKDEQEYASLCADEIVDGSSQQLPPDSAPIEGTTQELACLIIQNKNISYENLGANRLPTKQPFEELCAGKEASTEFNPSHNHTNVNPKILQLILGMAQSNKITISTLTNGNHGNDTAQHTKTIAHTAGGAFDLVEFNGQRTDGTTRADDPSRKVLELAVSLMQDGSYIGAGGYGCPALIVDTQGKDITFTKDEPCNHLHFATQW